LATLAGCEERAAVGLWVLILPAGSYSFFSSTSAAAAYSFSSTPGTVAFEALSFSSSLSSPAPILSITFFSG